MTDTKEASRLFKGDRIAFIPSDTLSPAIISEMASIVKKNGGEVLELNEKGRIAVHEASHIVSDTIDFEDYRIAQGMLVPVVSSDWIRHSLSRRKKAPVRPHSPDPRFIFHNVSLTCADIPPSDKEAIIGSSMALGATHSKDLTRLTTHICALSLNHEKCQTALQKGQNCKIVLPHWFDACFKLGRRIDEGPYLLPNPACLDPERKGEEVAVPSSQHLEGASAALPIHSMSVKTRKPTVFNRKKVMISDSLVLSDRFFKIVEDFIKGGGGETTKDVDECDMFVTHYRAGEDYIRAAQRGVDVGNLSWLLYLITQNQWTSPLRRLLHYPVPPDGIPGFKGLKITVSNYGGEARTFLENLIQACGAEFTKTMKQDNTHLITARAESEKCEAAMDWNVSMVNHLWIEESYARCQLQNIANNPKYTHFPERTHLAEVIGQTFLNEKVLHELYYPGGDDDADSVARRNHRAREAAEDNVFALSEARSSQQGSSAVQGPNSDSSTTGVTPARGPREDAAAPNSRTAVLGKANNNKAMFTTPARARRGAHGAGKENDLLSSSPMPSTGRTAKSKALNNLRIMAPDIELYEKEKKRTSRDRSGPWGGKRAASEIERRREAEAEAAATAAGKEANAKRDERDGADADEDDEDGDEDEAGEGRPAKRQRSGLPPLKYRICLTSFARWAPGSKHAAREDDERRKLRRLGIHIVPESQPCDYLAAPRPVRTIKFLVALAKGPGLLDSKFIEDAIEKNKVPNPEDYPLRDSESLSGSSSNQSAAAAAATEAEVRGWVKRARKNNGRLLRDVPIYCTEHVPHGPDPYKRVAEANGAIFKVYRARSGTTIRPTTAEEDGMAPPDPVYLICGGKPVERELRARFEEMARNGHMEPRVVSSDWLLDVCQRQEVVYDAEKHGLKGGRLRE